MIGVNLSCTKNWGALKAFDFSSRNENGRLTLVTLSTRVSRQHRFLETRVNKTIDNVQLTYSIFFVEGEKGRKKEVRLL